MMKKTIRNLSVLILPFLIMIFINEAVRPTIKEKSFSYYGVATINSSEKIENKCTWICHNQTNYCKQHHVKFLKKYFNHTDKLYFGLIDLLRSTGNYGLANIIILALLVPLLIWYFLVKSLNIQDEINYLKRQKNDF